MTLSATFLALSVASDLLLLQEPPPQRTPGPEDLTKLSLEELMNVEITTPARKEQKLMDTPSAVFVIRGEDIRRSGARSIAEALRMSPGLQVAQLDANKWAVSSRGFNGRFANKLLVLMDGRSVYSPISSGVFWDVQDTMLEDIERIEVIRGPGATMWGANAVNGVINIITKGASSTQGGYAEAGIGTELRDFAGARYGGAVGEGSHYRAYAKYLNHDGYGEGPDDWFMARAGFRADSKSGEQTVTILGDVYDGEVGERVTVPILTPPFSQTFSQHNPVWGANVLARWTLDTAGGSRVSAQTWLETTSRLGGIIDETRDTFDASVDHRVQPVPGHDVVWGGEFRFTRDDISNSESVQFNPTSRDAVIASVFLQDEITIVEEHLRVVLGAKFEYNTLSRRPDHPVEFQPSVRTSWTPDPAHAIWASASRAVRTPSRGEVDARSNFAVLPGPTELALISSDDFVPEELVALELGYRVRPMPPLTIDIAGFLNFYEDLRTFEPGAPFVEPAPPPPHAVVPFRIDNELSGRTYGVEVSVMTQPYAGWRLQAAYTYLRINLIPEDSQDPAAENPERESPRSQIYLRSSWDLPENLQLDVMPRYVGPLSALDVEAVAELDVRLAWRPAPSVEVSVTGQNLFHRSHIEFAPSIISTEATEVERGGYLMVSVRF